MTASEQREAAGKPKPEPKTVGQALREARAAQDLSLEQLAAELRIEAPQLAALEQDQFERIGVPVFVKGYLRQYGQRLGLNHADLLALYYEQGKLEDIDIRPSRTIKLRDEQQAAVWVVAFVLLAAIVGGLAYWWLNGAPGITLSAPVPPAEERTAPAQQPTLSSQESATLAGVSRVEVLPVSAAAAAPGPAPPMASEPASSPADGAPASPSQAAADEYLADLDITFVLESWAEITDARGTRLMFGLGAAGRQSVLRGEPPFTVVLGNANGVQLKLNGAPYEIPRAGRQGNRVSFTLDTAEE